METIILLVIAVGLAFGVGGSHKKNRFWAGICHLVVQCLHRLDCGALLKEN